MSRQDVPPRSWLVVPATFVPGEREIAHSRALLAALEAARSQGRGAVSLDGAMVDDAPRAGALAVLARAEPTG